MTNPSIHSGQRLPTGTVTFLFTDIESSTQLWEGHPEAMKAAHARHEIILRQAVAAHSGYAYKMIAACLAKMGEMAFSDMYDEGQKMTLDEALVFAFEES